MFLAGNDVSAKQDSALGNNGDWKKGTAIKDASNGKCAKAAKSEN